MFLPYDVNILKKLVTRGYTCGALIELPKGSVPEQSKPEYEDVEFREIRPFKSEYDMDHFIEKQKAVETAFTIFQEDGLEVAEGFDNMKIYINQELS